MADTVGSNRQFDAESSHRQEKDMWPY